MAGGIGYQYINVAKGSRGGFPPEVVHCVGRGIIIGCIDSG